MKTLKMILLIMIVSLFSNILSAQVSVGINIGTQRYYYLQDIESYYDNQTSMYIYLSGGRWIHARNLPASYGHYDLNNGHRIIIRDYRGNQPYNYYQTHRTSFPKGHYGSPDKNYWSYKEHKAPARSNMKPGKERRNPGHENGNPGNGRGKGPGNGPGNGNGHGKGPGNGNGHRK